MDLNDLNNKQVILLTMFVSFVVSVGTGILTAAILQEAPRTVTQTVNRVVERTIERVVTGTSTPKTESPAPIQTITKEVTVYAKEDDLIVSAVERNIPKIAHIYALPAATGTKAIAVGAVISRDGLIATDARELGETPAKRYHVSVGDKEYTADLVPRKEAGDIAFLRITDVPAGTVFDAVTWSAKNSAKVAQGLVVIGGDGGEGIQRTSVSRLRYATPVGTSTAQILLRVETTPKIASGSGGSLVVNLDGQALGIATWRENDGMYVVTPMILIFDIVQSLSAETAHSGGQTGIILPDGVPSAT